MKGCLVFKRMGGSRCLPPPATATGRDRKPRSRCRGHREGGLAVSPSCGCVQTSSVSLLIVFQNLLRYRRAARGIAFTVLGKGGGYVIQTLRWLLFTPISPFSLALLSLRSIKVCLIHKGLIAITDAAPPLWVLSLGSPCLFSGERT